MVAFSLQGAGNGVYARRCFMHNEIVMELPMQVRAVSFAFAWKNSSILTVLTLAIISVLAKVLSYYPLHHNMRTLSFALFL